MAQFLRPDSTVTATSFTNGFAEIDETTASDTDFAYTPDASSGTLEVGLSNPSGTPGSGSTTIRYRLGKSNDGVLDQAGTGQPTCTVSLVQGTTVLASDTLRTVATLTDYTWSSVDTSGVTDWNDVRLRFVAGSSGGNPTNRRGLAVIWTEIEAPDAPAPVTHATSGALTGQIGFISGSAARTRQHASSGIMAGLQAAIVGSSARTVVHTASGDMAGQAGALAGAAARTLQHAASGDIAGAGSSVGGSVARETNTVTHETTGALAGPESLLAGSFARTRLHASSGSLAGQGSTVSGAAARARVHATTAVLAGIQAAVAGSASRSGAVAEHTANGALGGQAGALVGSASRLRTFVASGALNGQGSSLVGDASRARVHNVSGALPGLSAVITADAARERLHASTGIFAGQDSTLAGASLVGIAPAPNITPSRIAKPSSVNRNAVVPPFGRIVRPSRPTP